MASHFRLSPLNEKETIDFLLEKMENAWVDKSLFEAEALELLSSQGRGNRRIILNLGANLCMATMAQDEKTVSADLVINLTLCDFAR